MWGIERDGMRGRGVKRIVSVSISLKTAVIV